MSAEPSGLSLRDYFSTQQERFTQADARTIGPELARLMDAGKRELGDVVEAARPADAPLHRYFTWDDAVAAERFRQMEAGRMVRAIKIQVTSGGQKHELPAFTPISIRVTPPATPAPMLPIGNTDRASPMGETRARPADRSTGVENPTPDGATIERRYAPRPAGQSIVESERKRWLDGQDPSLPVLPVRMSENLDKLSDEVLIARAMAMLLGFEATFGPQRNRERFQAIFGPVFAVIEAVAATAGLEGATD